MAPTESTNPRGKRAHLVALIVFVLLSLALTYPLIVQLNSHLAGDDIDAWINPWANWWLEKALVEGQDVYYTDYLFYPQGVSLAFHSFSPLNALFWWVLKPIAGTLAAYNLTVLLAYALSGYGMWALARYLTGSQSAAYLAGTIFAFSPYHMIEGSHPVIVSTQWMPLFALYLIRMLREGKLGHAILAALFLWLTALSSLHLFTFSILWAGLYLLHAWAFQRDLQPADVIKKLVIFGLLSAILIAPLFYPMLREQISGGVSYMGVEVDEGAGNHPWGFFLPSWYHPLFGSILQQVIEMQGLSGTRPAFVGFLVLVLALHTALTGGRKARFWAVSAIIFALLSLGPQIPLQNERVINVPWAPPVVALWRHPFRFNVLLSFSLSILAAYGLVELMRRLGARDSKRRRILIATAVIAITLFEYLTLPFPTTPVNVSPFYRQLADEEGGFAIAQVPMGRQPDKYNLYYQTIHGRPIVGGVVSRTPTDAYDYIAQNPLLDAALEDDEGSLGDISSVDVAHALSLMAGDDIRYLILHRTLLSQQVLEGWMDAIASDPVYEDDRLVVYSTTP